VPADVTRSVRVPASRVTLDAEVPRGLLRAGAHRRPCGGLDGSPGPGWGRFVKAQAERIIACDLFHIGTVFLKRICVLFFIEHATRPFMGVTTNLTGPWVAQHARNLLGDLSYVAYSPSTRSTTTVILGRFGRFGCPCPRAPGC
jgi:hypothetical protein